MSSGAEELTSRARWRDSVIVREVEGESVLLDLKKGYYFGLDAAGTRIWQLLQLNPRLRAVVSAMVDEYDVDEATCTRDLVAFVTDLHAHGLIDVS